jgi:hypothetical protein
MERKKYKDRGVQRGSISLKGKGCTVAKLQSEKGKKEKWTERQRGKVGKKQRDKAAKGQRVKGKY